MTILIEDEQQFEDEESWMCEVQDKFMWVKIEAEDYTNRLDMIRQLLREVV